MTEWVLCRRESCSLCHGGRGCVVDGVGWAQCTQCGGQGYVDTVKDAEPLIKFLKITAHHPCIKDQYCKETAGKILKDLGIEP